MNLENFRESPMDNLRQCTLFDVKLGNVGLVCDYKERRCFDGRLSVRYEIYASYRGVYVKTYYDVELYCEHFLRSLMPELGFRLFCEQRLSEKKLLEVLEVMQDDPEWGMRRMELEAAFELDFLDQEEE